MPFKWNSIWICSAFLWIDLRCKTLLFPLANMPVYLLKPEGTVCTQNGWVCYLRPDHKSSLIQGASWKCQCHWILSLWWSDLWPHTWCCCQTGSISVLNRSYLPRNNFTHWSWGSVINPQDESSWRWSVMGCKAEEKQKFTTRLA